MASSSLILYLTMMMLVHLVNGQSETAQQASLYEKPWNFVRTANASKTSFNEEEKVLLLKLHNAYRSMVQPPARNMREMVWDTDLENYARQHSQACSGAHSARSMVKVWSPLISERWDLMGENLYWSYGDRYSLEEALWMFWEEGSGYDISANTCTHRLTCGHYKVLVLESSWRVGCSINQCDSFTDNPYPGPAMFMTCSYNGMYLDAARPYSVGEACSGCNRETVGTQFANCRNRLCDSRFASIIDNITINSSNAHCNHTIADNYIPTNHNNANKNNNNNTNAYNNSANENNNNGANDSVGDGAEDNINAANKSNANNNNNTFANNNNTHANNNNTHANNNNSTHTNNNTNANNNNTHTNNNTNANNNNTHANNNNTYANNNIFANNNNNANNNICAISNGNYS
ncbi:hypothetical protein ElyMa_001824400 [Elysia marginata]|uniref:SCP domain-containing protein n=1 Tax=Elysia marginata TaxID=1093978 RepID=A0AAV4EJV7_9GAST|nr:hypothetical protein ElyMa_001824400 [Elysia marginata]